MIPDLHRHAVLSSTMDEARALALAGAPEGTMVQADEQTAARGRFGNAWVCQTGNLYMTIVLRPAAPVRDVAQLSFATALALAEAVNRPDLTLKWPNDVLAGGRKLAGILLEMESGRGDKADFLLIGIGVNIVGAPEGRAYVNEYGLAMTADDVRDGFFAALEKWYGIWAQNGFAPVREAWLKRAHGLGGLVTARMARESVQGHFHGIDANGALMLMQEDGTLRPVASADIHFDTGAQTSEA